MMTDALEVTRPSRTVHRPKPRNRLNVAYNLSGVGVSQTGDSESDSKPLLRLTRLFSSLSVTLYIV